MSFLSVFPITDSRPLCRACNVSHLQNVRESGKLTTMCSDNYPTITSRGAFSYRGYSIEHKHTHHDQAKLNYSSDVNKTGFMISFSES